MNYLLRYTPIAVDDLRKINHIDASRIKNKLDYFVQSQNPMHYAKKLTRFSRGTYRFRIGPYRAIFDIDKNGMVTVLSILTIKHRKEAYE